MKKIVYYFGILFVLVVILVNLLFTARLDTSEHVEINFNEFFYIWSGKREAPCCNLMQKKAIPLKGMTFLLCIHFFEKTTDFVS